MEHMAVYFVNLKGLANSQTYSHKGITYRDYIFAKYPKGTQIRVSSNVFL